MGLQAKNVSVMRAWRQRARSVGMSDQNISSSGLTDLICIKDREMKAKIVDSCRLMLQKTMKGDYCWLFSIGWDELESLETVLKIMRSQIEM